MIKKIVFFIVSILFFQSNYAQIGRDSLILHLNLKFANELVELNKTYVSNNDSLQISQLRFYISGIEIEYNDQTLFKQKNSFHLIDIENPNSLQIPITENQNKIVKKLSFAIGIDSITNVAGALGGDLDATKGMYWAWQSGYINMKIEGKSNSCKTRKNEFQFHIGGYLKPFYAYRKVELYPKSENLDVIVDIAALFNHLKLSDINSIMIPCKKAMEIADLYQNIFKIE